MSEKITKMWTENWKYVEKILNNALKFEKEILVKNAEKILNYKWKNWQKMSEKYLKIYKWKIR